MLLTDSASLGLEDPQKDQPCCVYISDELTWYRGEIIDASVSSQIMVNLVDRAVVKTVPSNSVRILYPVFLSLPALAVSCSIAHLQPTGIMWNPGRFYILFSCYESCFTSFLNNLFLFILFADNLFFILITSYKTNKYYVCCMIVLV